MNNLIIKKFLAYLFLFFGLGFVFTSNSYSADVKFVKCKLYESETDYYTTFEIDLKKNDVYRIFYKSHLFPDVDNINFSVKGSPYGDWDNTIFKDGY